MIRKLLCKVGIHMTVNELSGFHGKLFFCATQCHCGKTKLYANYHTLSGDSYTTAYLNGTKINWNHPRVQKILYDHDMNK